MFLNILFVCFLLFMKGNCDDGVLCQPGFCRTFHFEVGCVAPVAHCSINNATHNGMWLPSPTICNCCNYCLRFFGCVAPVAHCSINNATHNGMWLPSPTICNCCNYCLRFFGANEECSIGGPGTGTTVGRCGPGLTCVEDEDGHPTCQRMESKCHSAQDDYDSRREQGELGTLEYRPICDGKGKFGAFDCVPTQTCFCQSEEGERTFGEVLNLGAATERNMHCGCSKLHEKITKNISPAAPYPVVGPRCTSDGNFNPVQCVNRTCFCVNTVTGVMVGSDSIDLDRKPITELPCYDSDLDLFPSQSEGEPPYNYTTPCIESLNEQIKLLKRSAEEGFEVDFFNKLPGCLPDGTFGRMAVRNGTQICIDERGMQIGDYGVVRNSPEFHTMDCKCAQRQRVMQDSLEQPVCCKNGNFRRIQCRRGLCRCVDSEGRQIGRENADVTQLKCHTPDWRQC